MSLLREAERCFANQATYRRLNAFITVASRSAVRDGAQQADALFDRGPLDGRLIAIKDNICTRELPTTCASDVLRPFASPHDATVVTKLRDVGALIAGKTNLDEFGMGSHSTYSAFGPVSQERAGFVDETKTAYSAGGSSGGSAVAVATEQCWAALGTDTGGSVRLPAAYTETVGFKPSYGLISRWGVIAYANSFDTVGILSRTVQTARQVFDVLNEHDPKDPTSLAPSTRMLIAASARRRDPDSRPLRVGVPVEYNVAELSQTVRAAWLATLSTLQHALKAQVEIMPVSIPSTRQALSAYYVLAPAEASSNLAKYDGIRYGARPEDAQSDAPDGTVLFSQSRGRGLGAEVKRRILLGTYSLSASAMDNYFIQAQKVRRVLQQDFDRVFRSPNPLIASTEAEAKEGRVDVLIHPTAPSMPPTLEEVRKQAPLERYLNDVFTVPASLAGLPAVSVPLFCGDVRQGSACGMQVVGQFGQDETVLHVAQMIEDALRGTS